MFKLKARGALNGQHIIGTPAVKLSNVEFQPECVKKTPTAEWHSNSSCVHQLVIRPLSLISCKNSGGSTADSPFKRSGLITHKKL
ncbi:hypothetical protein IEQ34_017758 [Dendrobium chrysotoxum]|uniref:Uncharacterized protein n=1 Tax=Dendrobium chrysotoxum TaxID=161865 RepID=A0AAV7FUX7_DENCH|nr:hypothetical protein IEQ34_017758 [Dendrobium chrysotoxum]